VGDPLEAVNLVYTIAPHVEAIARRRPSLDTANVIGHPKKRLGLQWKVSGAKAEAEGKPGMV